MSQDDLSILDWINFGKVSAERDDLLSDYFFDNGVLKSTIDSRSSFLILGRKGAGKTALFRYLKENSGRFIGCKDILIPLSFEDYNWNVHALLVNENKAESLLYKQSWKFIILTQCIKAYHSWFREGGRRAPYKIASVNNLLETLFSSPIPSVFDLVSHKLLSLSKIRLPKAEVGIEDGQFDKLSADGGEVTFDQVRSDINLKRALSENIETIIIYMDESLRAICDEYPDIFICFDRVDEGWDDVSFDSSRKVISGLVTACDSITSSYRGKIRPILFLREDIFDTLSINDSNKLREDCGNLLYWERVSLQNMILRRVNYFGQKYSLDKISNIDSLFDKPEMRQRAKPWSYLLRRTMMRPRDFISLLNRVVDAMKEKVNDPFSDECSIAAKLECESIYKTEPGYSEWLKKEIIDEWRVQRPIILDLLTAIQNNGSTNIDKIKLQQQMTEIGKQLSPSDTVSALRFLFNNSIIGFKLGSSTEWRFKCFYPSQGFVESEEYRVHEGLVRALNLTESRSREANDHILNDRGAE